MTLLLAVPAAVPAQYQPDLAPVADSLTLSALIALLPLVTVFVTLGVLKWKAHWAGLSAVLVAIFVAAVFFGMPVQLAALMRILIALFPYLLVIAVFSVAKLVPPVKELLTATDLTIPWPGLDGQILTASGEVSGATTYTLAWLSSPGSMLLFCGLIVAFVYGIGISGWAGEVAAIAHKMRFAYLTVASMLALAYVMNFSGQTITIGTWIAGTGAAFAFLSPTLGWIGTAVTGSDTSANALFATLQQSAPETAGIDPTLLVAANTSGGVVGKMISPQNLTIAATAVGLIGRESDILRKVLPWSIGLMIAMCILVGLQSTVLAWMLP